MRAGFGGSFRMQPIHFPPSFWEFMDLWFQDERNHYDGFVRLMKKLTGFQIPTSDLRDRPDYSLIAEVATTSLSWLCLIALDEYITVRGYALDLVLIYSRLGSVARHWKTLVISDEHNHFRNVVSLLRRYYPEQLQETRKLLQAWVDFELRYPQYHRTFVFNRGSLRVNEDFLRACAETVWQEIAYLPKKG